MTPSAKIIFAICFLISSLAFAQVPDTLWTRQFGGYDQEEGMKVIEVYNGGIVAVGSTRSFGHGGWDIYLIKTDASGDSLWARTFGDTLDDKGYSVAESPGHSLAIAGYITRPWRTHRDMCLIRTTYEGGIPLIRNYPDTVISEATSIDLTNDGGFILGGRAGVIWPQGPPNYYSKIIKTDFNGVPSWNRIFLEYENNRIMDIKKTNDGGFVTTGRFQEDGGIDILSMKLNGWGLREWSSRIFCYYTFTNGRAIIEIIPNDKYIIAGECANFYQNDSNAILYEYNYYDNRQNWTIHFPYKAATSAIATSDNRYVVCGYDSLPYWKAFVAKVDMNGEQVWVREFPTGTTANSIIQTSDGGFVITGKLGNDLYLAKLAPEFPTQIENENLPDKPSLSQNYPNPFNAYTIISYSLPKLSDVTIDIFDLLGRKIDMISLGMQPAGEHEFKWNGEQYNSGVYFYTIKAGDFSETRKMVLMK